MSSGGSFEGGIMIMMGISGCLRHEQGLTDIEHLSRCRLWKSGA